MTAADEVRHLRKLLEDIRQACLTQPGVRAVILAMIDASVNRPEKDHE